MGHRHLPLSFVSDSELGSEIDSPRFPLLLGFVALLDFLLGRLQMLIETLCLTRSPILYGPLGLLSYSAVV